MIKESLGMERADEPADQTHVEFDARNVRADEEHELEYYGSVTYEDEDGVGHSVGRRFVVYTDESRLEDGLPSVEVTEEHMIADGEGGSDVVDSREFDLVAEISADLPARQRDSRIESYLKNWHHEHTERW